MDPIARALLAVQTAQDGDTAAAHAHIATAQRHVRGTARRDRQLVEMAALVVAGSRARAAGLAWEHTAEFPADVAILGHIADANTRDPG
jgi:hypothetical protein